MTDAGQFLAQVVASLGTMYVVFLGISAIQYASKGSAGAQVFGAALILMGFGNMQDPTMERVQQIRQLKKYEEEDSGASPETEE